MSASLLLFDQTFNDANGNPLSSGKVWTYVAGTNTPKATWADAAQSSLNTNPVLLNAAGRATIFGDGGYKVVVMNSADVIQYTRDYIFPAVVQNIQVEIDTKISKLGDVTPAGIYSFDVTGPTVGYGFRISSSSTNHPSTNPMVLLESFDVGGNQPMLYIKKATGGSGGNANLKLEGPTVDIEFVEDDQVSPAGKWEISASSNRLQLNSRNSVSTRFETLCQWRQLADTGVQQASGPASFVAAPYSDGDANAYGSLNTGTIAVIGEPTGTAWINIEAVDSIVGTTGTYTNSGYDAVIRLKSSNTEWKMRADKVNQRFYIEREAVPVFEIRNEGYLKTISIVDTTLGRLYFGTGTTTYLGNSPPANTIDITGPTGVGLRVAGKPVSARDLQYAAMLSGGNYDIVEGGTTNQVILDNAGVVATFTVTMPLNPRDTTVVVLSSRTNVTALTVTVPAGDALYNTATALAGGAPVAWMFRKTDRTWYRTVS